MLAGTLIGLFAWYWQWAAWLAKVAAIVGLVAVRADLVHASVWALEPDIMLRLARQLLTTGIWGIGHQPVKGGPLVFFWLVEFLIVVGATALMARAQSRKPFCEITGSWARHMLVPIRFGPLPETAGWRARFAENPAGLFAALEALPMSGPGFSSLSLYVCAARTHVYASVVSTRISIDEGKEWRFRETVVEHLRIDAALAEAALQRWQAPPMQQAPIKAVPVTQLAGDDTGTLQAKQKAQTDEQPKRLRDRFIENTAQAGVSLAAVMMCSVAEAAFSGADNASADTDADASD